MHLLHPQIQKVNKSQLIKWINGFKKVEMKFEEMLIPVWNTDFLASNNFFHTLLNSRGFFIERDFSIHRDLSSGIFPFTEIFFPLAGFFIPFDWNLWSLFKIRRFLKKWLEDFSLLVKKKLSIIHVNIHPAGFSIYRDFFIPHLNLCFSYRNVIVPKTVFIWFVGIFLNTYFGQFSKIHSR